MKTIKSSFAISSISMLLLYTELVDHRLSPICLSREIKVLKQILYVFHGNKRTFSYFLQLSELQISY